MKKGFAWNEEKNQKLMKERGISFETIVSYIEGGNIIAIVPGKHKFSHQNQYLVAVNDYVYIVPFVEEKNYVFLKTIIPSRKMTKRHLLGGD